MAKRYNVPVQKTAAAPLKPADAGKKYPAKVKFGFLLAIIAFAVYTNTLSNGFVFDDSNVITKNTIVTKGIAAIPEILSTPYRSGFFVTSNDMYRPLSLVLFATEYQFFEKNPAPYHFINIVLYVGCVLLLFLFLDHLVEQKTTGVAFISSLLFALHPIHTEVVANIKSCDELLCFFFALLSLNVFMKYVESRKTLHLLTGAFCFLASLLAKESSITFLAIIPLVFFFFRNEHRRQSLNITIGVVIAAVAFLSIRYAVLNNYRANESANILFSDNALAKPGLGTESRIATAILVLGYYVKLLVVPYPLSCDYSYDAIPFAHFSDSGVLLSIAVYILLIGLAIFLFYKDRRNPYAFGIMFFLVTISLFSNIPFLIGAEMGERFLFFGSAGFCLVAACLLKDALRPPLLKNNVQLWIMIALSVIYAATTINRNKDWTDNLTLYSADVKKFPGSLKLNFLLAVELENSMEENTAAQPQLIADVVSHLNRSLSVYPEYNDAINNLAEVYFFDKKYEEAITLFKKSIALVPDFVNPYANAGACYASLGKYDSAIYYLNRAISIDPGYKASYEIIVPVYKELGNMDSVKKYQLILQHK